MKKLRGCDFYKIVYHAVYFGVTSTSHDFIFTEYVYAAPEEKDVTGVLIMLAMVILSGTMSFVQSVKSSNAVEKLQNMIKVTATVIRDKKQMEIPIEEVVCGDLVQLSAGDMIPADLRLIQSKDLFVSQSSLTGESFPIENTRLIKKIVIKLIQNTTIFCFRNKCN